MADNGKTSFVMGVDCLDNEGLIIAWQDSCGYDFYAHNPIKREQFHDDLDEVFLEYKAHINRQKAENFAAKADECAGQAAELRACGTKAERTALSKRRAAQNLLADDMGITVERLREMLGQTA